MSPVTEPARLNPCRPGGAIASAFLYPAGSGMLMTFLDDTTMLFGDAQAVHNALDARDGETPSVTSNADITSLIASVEDGAIWSVLDSIGTQNMLRSAMGDAAKLADFDVVKKRLTGSYYTVDFTHGVSLDLTVATGDPMASATLSTRKSGATGPNSSSE